MKSSLKSNVDVKRQNRIQTLRCIFANKRVSQTELSAKLALSWPTILTNVKELLEMGLIQEVGQYKSTGGRKAKAYAPIVDARLAVGLDLTANHISVVLVNLAGEVVHYKRLKKPFVLNEEYLKDLGILVDQFIQDHCNSQQVLGVGISLPGIVDNQAKILLHSHVLNLKDVPLSEFSRYINYSCSFINDANAGGLAEVYGRDSSENLVYLSLSNSVGGAILNDGTLYTGNHLRAGEFGHMTLVPDGKLCYCGKKGCLDAYCSARVLADQTDGNLGAFFVGVYEKNPVLQQAWEEYLDNLAVAVNNLHMIFDCNVIVGGYVGTFLEEYGQSFSKRLESRNTFNADSSYLKYCKYRLEASAVGAALTQIERFVVSI